MNWLIISSFVAACFAGPVPTKSPEEGVLFEGDMILTPEQVKAIAESEKHHTSYAALKSDKLWLFMGKAETIKYYIDPKISKATSVIEQAIAEYHASTCIRFERVYSKPFASHIHFTDGLGCSSPVGRQMRGNIIHLPSECWHKGTIQHEMGHSLGFHHEQSRPDRDKYVDVLWENIIRGYAYNFKKYGYDRIDSRGFEYDLDSMMHYGGHFFSRDRMHKLTIRTKNPKMQRRIGQRWGMSRGDVAQLRKMYHC